MLVIRQQLLFSKFNIPDSMKIGYARVSTTGQNLDMQLDSLMKAGCEKIYTEKESGVKERPVLNELLSYIRQGDELVVYKLDRLGRSLKDLLNIVDDLQTRQINLVSLNDNFDAKTPSGKLMMQLFAILAEYERNLIVERTKTGRMVAMKNGKKMGRPKILQNTKADACSQLYKGGMSIPDIMTQLDIKSRSTVYRFLRMNNIEPNRKSNFIGI